jgi:hypothetical protein
MAGKWLVRIVAAQIFAKVPDGEILPSAIHIGRWFHTLCRFAPGERIEKLICGCAIEAGKVNLTHESPTRLLD